MPTSKNNDPIIYLIERYVYKHITKESDFEIKTALKYKEELIKKATSRGHNMPLSSFIQRSNEDGAYDVSCSYFIFTEDMQ